MKLKRIIVLVMIVSLMVCNISYAAKDARSLDDLPPYTILDEQIDVMEDGIGDEIVPYSEGFTTCNLSLGSYDSYLRIYFGTGYSKKVSQIGMYNFKLQKKVWYGWTDVFSRSELANNNTTFCSRSYDITAEHGETYRLKGTHFAIVGGTVKTLANSTVELKYK